MGLPTEDVFTLIMMMNAMSEELPSVCDHIADCIAQSTTLQPYSSHRVRLRLDVEQQLVEATKANSAGPLALTASALAPTSSSRHVHKTCRACGVTRHGKCCTNCNGIRHTADECFREGGGHVGQRDAVLAEKAAKRAKGGKGTTSRGNAATKPITAALLKPAGKPGTVWYATNGRAYFVDPESNQAFLLSSEADTNVPETQEFAGLASNVMTPSFLRTLPDDIGDEYDALIADLPALHSTGERTHARLILLG
ncbi:hypothetical protein PAXRUDRAFT_17026 [Paxillus rubicundulus Ve08.2h10]|uniref:Uncharacterized protein n=1 Tax=Paxillus rubicundulus Ve08.2h10 TaxID=930991 RepID=A0A0D0DJ67_9AGAM|nr:hypothetical protein PAXRUDRAFT_17026 [Paxillus rubicundulus Ve08.2h10]